MASGLFRTIGVVGRELVIANSLAAFTLLVFIISGGFLLAHHNVKKWWIWAYWSSPLMYAQNAISVNEEFLGHTWKKILPGAAESLGLDVSNFRGMFTEAKWYWISIGALIGYVVLFNFFFTMALPYLSREPMMATGVQIHFGSGRLVHRRLVLRFCVDVGAVLVLVLV